MSKNKSLKQLQKEIQEFNKERSWEKYHSPNNLIAAITAELGELADHYRWREDYNFLSKLSKDEKEALEFESVDVLNYLMDLANYSNIDISSAYEKKMPKLREKFPVNVDFEKAHKDYRKSGKNKNYK